MRIVRLSTLSVIMLFLATGCGESELASKNISDLMPSSCKVSVEKIKKFEDPEALGEINCLEEQLDAYTKGVRRDDPEHIDRKDLKDFVNRFVPELAKGFDKSSRLLFLTSNILYRSPKDKIAVSDLKSIFDLLRTLNFVASNIDPILNADNGEYWEKREVVIGQLQALQKVLEAAVDKNRSQPSQSINLPDFLELLFEDDYERSIYEAMSSLKRPLVGGDRENINSDDAILIVKNLLEISTIGFDLYKFEEKGFEKEHKKNKFFVEQIDKLRPLIYGDGGNARLMENKDLVTLLKEFEPDYYNEHISNSLDAGKMRLVGGYASSWDYNDFMSVFDIGKELFQLRQFSDLSFEIHKELLVSPNKIEDIEFVDHEDYPNVQEEVENTFWSIFSYMAKHRRTFRREDDTRAFTPEYQRTRYGLTEAVTLYWASDIFLETYGQTDSEKGFKFLQEPEMERALVDLKGILIALDLWTVDLKSYVDGSLLSSDIFRTHSNGDIKVSKTEFADFVDHVFTSLSVADGILEKMPEYCEVHDSQYGKGFLKQCFRDNLPQVLMNDLNRRDDYPGVISYWDEIGYDEYHDWLDLIEEYTVIFPDDNEVMFREEIARLIQGIADVETIMMADDIDGDGILSNKELDKTYWRYRAQIIKAESMLKYAKSISYSAFLYMIKNNEEPGVTQALTYHLFGRGKKDVTGRRKDISFVSSRKGGFSVP